MLSQQEDHLEKEMATHTSILSWKTPWTAWRATAYGVPKSQVGWVHTHTHTHILKLLVIPLCEHLNLRQQWSGFEIWSEPCGPAETLVLLELSAPVGFFFKGKIVYQQKIWKSQLIIQAEPLNYMVFKVGIEGGFRRPK